MAELPLLKADYISPCYFYQIKKPEIESGGTYYFQTESGLAYQVTFGKKKNNYLSNIVNFSVLSDEYEDEYSVTNRGELYHIICTMIEVVRIYHENHPYSTSYEFAGEFKDMRDEKEMSIRTRLYFRVASRVMDLQHWNLSLDGNKVIITRKHL
jgi:hypothetical protein